MRRFDPSTIDVMDLLEILEVRNLTLPSEEQANFSCPYPSHSRGDEKPSCYMNTGVRIPEKTGLWMCQGCHESGGAFKLVAYMMNVSPIKAIGWLRAAYDPMSLDPDEINMAQIIRDRIARRDKPKSEVVENPLLDISLIARYQLDWRKARKAYEAGDGFDACDYMFGRGFSVDTLEAWQFGYDEITDRLVFPVRDELGRLVGFKGRATDEDRRPKYMVMGDKPQKKARHGYPIHEKSLVVFGLDRALNYMDVSNNRTLIVCEGELNAIALHQMGYSNAVAVNGSYLSRVQELLLRQYADRIVCFFDSDMSGQRGIFGWVSDSGEYKPGLGAKLEPFVDISVVPDHEHDPAKMLELGLEDEVSECIAEAASIRQLRLVRSQ